jgi:hypothetical protein
LPLTGEYAVGIPVSSWMILDVPGITVEFITMALGLNALMYLSDVLTNPPSKDMLYGGNQGSR